MCLKIFFNALFQNGLYYPVVVRMYTYDFSFGLHWFTEKCAVVNWSNIGQEPFDFCSCWCVDNVACSR